ncbi:MAG: DUF4281 domain-containing protein [Acidobacteria bacterium]|nr:MAG: DUF4281 domain-containing protein [Acidobacteriota bacterium]
MIPVTPGQIFTYSNILVMPAWALLVFAPGWKWTRIIAAYLTPALLAIAWIYITVDRFTPVGGGFGSLDQVAEMLSDPWFIVAGWQHALILDLFVGAWEARDAQRLGIPHGFVIPCLVLTFLAGPIGLIVYFLVRVAVVRRLPWK